MQERLLLLLLLPSLAVGLRGFFGSVLSDLHLKHAMHSMLVLTNGSGLLGLAAYAKKRQCMYYFCRKRFFLAVYFISEKSPRSICSVLLGLFHFSKGRKGGSLSFLLRIPHGGNFPFLRCSPFLLPCLKIDNRDTVVAPEKTAAGGFFSFCSARRSFSREKIGGGETAVRVLVHEIRRYFRFTPAEERRYCFYYFRILYIYLPF